MQPSHDAPPSSPSVSSGEESSNSEDDINQDVEKPLLWRHVNSQHRHSSPQLWPRSYRQSTDAYSLGASPKASPCSWGARSSLQRKHRKRQWCASMATLCDKDTGGSDDAQCWLQEGTPPDSVTILLHSPSKHLPSVNGVCEEQHLNDASCKLSENMPSNVIPLLHSREEENSQINEKAPGQSGLMHATFNGVNVMAGVGLLSCPYAVKEGGWLGMIALVLFAIVCCYTGHLLRRCMDSRPLGVLTSYPDIGQIAFGKIGRTIISIVLYAELYAYCVEFLILEGDNLSKLYPTYQLTMAGINFGSHAIFAIFATMVIMPTVWLENLNWLSALSFMGVLTTSLVMALVAWEGAFEGIGFSKTTKTVNWRDLPLAMGVYSFCYSGHAVFPNIYYSMKSKSRYTSVLLISFIVCFLFYATMSVVGFRMFGDETLSQITLNLPKTNKATYIALYTTILNPFTKFALIITPIANGIQELIPMEKLGACKRRVVKLTLRTILVISTLCVATMVPFFGYMMSFIGSVLTMLVTVIFPCTCFLMIYKDKTTRLEVIACSIIIVIGVITSAVGMYSSVIKIASKF